METPVSLLERLKHKPLETDWYRLDQLYRPLIRQWLRRDPTLRHETDDLVQEVMTVLTRELVQFDRQRLGSFRSWLKTITLNRLKMFWRSCKNHPEPLNGTSSESPLSQLADPASELSQLWDRQHDQHVIHRLLEMVQPDFEPTTWKAFQQVMLNEHKIEEVARNLGISANAVMIAKCRVIKRLRQEGEAFVD